MEGHHGETIYIQVQQSGFDGANPDDNDVLLTLQQQVQQEQQQRLQLEQELQAEREKNAELERQLGQTRELSGQAKLQHEGQLKRIKHELLKGDPFEYSGKRKSAATTKMTDPVHTCDECSFHTKSEVSIILHKMNHAIQQKQFLLSATCFTTRNTNSKQAYVCPACDDSPKMTRHEVYRHVYEVHTNEKPHKCSECEYSFTHADYLADHRRDKHAHEIHQANNAKKMRVSSSSGRSSAVVVVASSNGGNMTTETASAVASITPKMEGADGVQYTPARGRRPAMTTPVATEFKCSFPDCGFITNSQEKLDFHVKAHTNTKYKCPYCPYVSNTLIDIKRHIQKSKKHEGQKVYACQQCGYGSDCDRTFKDHLRNYHFGLEAPENMMDYFIEEMFSNKNKKSLAEA